MSVRQFVDAGEILRGLHERRWKPESHEEEVNVTFRGYRGAVGRRDFATHWIHWYPAKMFHKIPSTFFDAVQFAPFATIADPFCGSGTVLLEANLRGYDAIGTDINPLARLISQAKTKPVDPDHLRDQRTALLTVAKASRSTPIPDPTLDYWLSPDARIGLHRLLNAVTQLEEDDARVFYLVTLTSIVRRVSNADPAIPPLVRLRQERAPTGGTRYRRALERSRAVNVSSVYTAFAESAAANIDRMSELYGLRDRLGCTRLSPTGTDAALTGLPPETIDAIVTSPPYCGSQKYVRSLKLELRLIGCGQDEIRAIDRQTLGTEAVLKTGH